MLKDVREAASARKKAAGRMALALALLAVLAGAAIAYLPSVVQHYSIGRQPLPEYERAGLSPATGEIDKEAGTVLLAQNEGRELYLDARTLNLKVVDAQSGATWNSLYEDGKSGDAEKSPLLIRFLGKDSALYEWDAYKYAIQNGRYTLNRIDGGVQIVLDFFESESYRLQEYLPQKISIEHYEKLFLEKLEQEVSQGKLTEAQAKKHEESLSIAYQRDEDNGLYFFKFSGLPPLSLVKDLIQFSKAVGYTTEMLLADSQQYGISVTIAQPARFVVTMEAKLDRGDLVVRVPSYSIEGDNDFYTIQNISVLPAFGLVSAEKAEDGQIVVPDGAGALFQINTFNGKFPEYERPLYDNTYYNTLYELPEYPETLSMPVFGLYATDLRGRSQGHLGIVEKGAELGYVKVQLGTKDASAGGSLYNKVYSSFDSTQYSRVKVFGPYSDNEARFLADTGLIPVDYTVRYKLFAGKADYYDLARTYRQHLIDTYGLKPAYSTEPKLFLDVIGTVTLEKRRLGVPYTEPYSMTTYSQLLDIVKDLQDVNAVVNYKGVFNGGMDNTIGNKAELVGANGSRKELEALRKQVESGNGSLFLHADLMRVADTSGGFWPKSNALYGYDGKPVEIRKYNYAFGKFDPDSRGRYLLHPLRLSDTVDKFLKDSQAYPNLSLGDMGSTYYASYNPREIVDPVISRGIVEENLKKLSAGKKLVLDNPAIDRIGYAAYASDISRESSGYATMYSSIPFRQLVMNGLTEYTTLDVNLAADRRDYFLLQALELGSLPKFTISAENVDVLKNSEYSDYFSMQYSVLADEIKAVYAEYSEGLAAIGSKEIVGHRMLADHVFETTYASGASVIVNYNKFPVAAAGSNLDALGYVIQPTP